MRLIESRILSPTDSVSYYFIPYCSNCDAAVVLEYYLMIYQVNQYTHLEYDLVFHKLSQCQQYCQFSLSDQNYNQQESPQ